MSHGTTGSATLPYRSSLSGVSEAASVDVMTIDTGYLKSLGFIVQNNDGVNSIDVQVVTMMNVNGSIEYTELDWTTVTAGSTLRYFENQVVGLLILRIRDTIGGSSAAYSVEYMGVR